MGQETEQNRWCQKEHQGREAGQVARAGSRCATAAPSTRPTLPPLHPHPTTFTHTPTIALAPGHHTRLPPFTPPQPPHLAGPSCGCHLSPLVRQHHLCRRGTTREACLSLLPSFHGCVHVGAGWAEVGGQHGRQRVALFATHTTPLIFHGSPVGGKRQTGRGGGGGAISMFSP